MRRPSLESALACVAVAGALTGCPGWERLPFREAPPLPPLDLEDPYGLPDPLVKADGSPVADARDWWFQRRPEILALFASEVYGRTPRERIPIHFETLERDADALGELAARRSQHRLHFGRGPERPAMDLLVYLPAGAERVPLFLVPNFRGNHSVHADPAIFVTTSWMPDNEPCQVVNHVASEAGRGCRGHRFPIEQILARGYGFATFYHGDLDPDLKYFGEAPADLAQGFRDGIHPLFYRPGQARPDPDEWGAVGAWAWGMSRALDMLQRRGDVGEVFAVGHSRLGKTALWAGAQDPRFAAVISNDSGAVGAALSRRGAGETIADITTAFPHWFAGNLRRYANDEAALPVDQHMLLALVAPRPVYVASAREDAWADPQGEFESALHAGGVYRFLGRPGLTTPAFPVVDRPVVSHVGYHVRTGGHDLTSWDWQRFMDFTDLHFGRGSS